MTKLKRRYALHLISTGIAKARSIDKTELRKVKEKTQNNILPFISTFNPKNPNAFKLIQQHIPILMKDKKMKDILQTHRFIKSQRQSKSLKMILTRAEFKTTYTSPSVKKCDRHNCGTCHYLNEGPSITFANGKTFTVKHNITCSSKNLIYVITCSGCHKQYIGQTGNSLQQRVTIHKQHIRQPQYSKLYVSDHIRQCAKSYDPMFTIFPFYKCYDNINEQQRLLKEQYFQNVFNPILNRPKFETPT